MKTIQKIGIVFFLTGLIVFSVAPFLGSFKLTREGMLGNLNEQELTNLQSDFENEILNKEFSSSSAFSSAVLKIYNDKNNTFRENEQWDKVMYTQPKEFAFK